MECEGEGEEDNEKRNRNKAIATSVEISKPKPVVSPPQSEIILAGFILTLITGLPNLKIASASVVAAHIGTVSSALFVLGGITGGYQRKWLYLLPGIILQLIALSYLFISIEFDERYENAYIYSE